jgi:hypothetical protein
MPRGQTKKAYLQFAQSEAIDFRANVFRFPREHGELAPSPEVRDITWPTMKSADKNNFTVRADFFICPHDRQMPLDTAGKCP